MSQNEPEPEDRNVRTHGYFYSVACALVAGSAFVVGDLALKRCDPVTFSALIFGFAAPVTGFWAIRGPRCTLRGPVLWPFLVHVLLSIAGVWFFWTAVQRLDPAVAGFLSRTQALVVIALSILFLGERLRPIEVVGGILALGGVALMKSTGASGAVADKGEGFWLMICAAVSIGVSENCAKLAVRHTTPAYFVGARNAALAIAFVVLALCDGEPAHLEGRTIGLAFLTALLAPILGRSFYMRALKRLELSRIALIQQGQPIVTALVALAVLGTVPEAYEWMGGLLVMTGCALVVWGAARAQRQSS